MSRQESRRPSRRPDNERYGCFNAVLDFLLLDVVFNALIDFGCSGCLGLIFTACVAAVCMSHGLSHWFSQRPSPLAFHPIRP